MPGISNTYEIALLQWMFKQVAWPVTAPTTLFISLHTAPPTDDRTTAVGNELSGFGYGRAQLDPDPGSGSNVNWNAVVDGAGTVKQISNKNDVTFNPASGGNWNAGLAIANFGLFTVGTAGTDNQYLGSGTITGNGVIVLSGNTLKFLGGSTGNLIFTVD